MKKNNFQFNTYHCISAITCGKKHKAAFTFAELMVSLVIISVITALLYPTIAEIAPNNNKQLYRSAYKNVENVVADIIQSDGALPATSSELCLKFRDRLNVVQFVPEYTKKKEDGTEWTDPDGKTTPDDDSPNGCSRTTGAPQTIQTSNGMRWWFQGYDAPSKTHTIFVDVNSSNNASNFVSQPCAACTPKADPANFCNGSSSEVWKTGCFRQLNNPDIAGDTTGDVGRDTFRIEIRSDGKINPGVDAIGMRHLRDISK